MEKNESGKKLELMLIVDANLNNDDKQSIYKEATEAVKKAGGKILNSQVWMEKHKLTFPIRKCREGSYYCINFEGGGDVNEKIHSNVILNERILRFVIIDSEPAATAQAVKA